MPIDPCLEQGVFEPAETAAMGEAFEAACKELHEVGQLPMVRKLVAKRIITAARKGVLDPVRLRVAALGRLSVNQMSPAASHCADYRPQAAKAPSAPARSSLIR